MGDRDHLFQQLCHEAVVACGTDRDAIERYVRGRIEAMDETDRKVMTRDLDRILGFQAPTASAKVN